MCMYSDTLSKAKTKNRLVSGRQLLKKETQSAGMKLFLDPFFGLSIVVLLMNKSTYTMYIYMFHGKDQCHSGLTLLVQ